MTIHSKLSDVGGVRYVVSDPTDIDDLNGFSDSIQAVGAAKTAKFSDGSIMRANPELRIGITKLKINTGNAILPIRTEVAADFVNFPADGNTVDDDKTTSSSSLTESGVAVIDYGSVATRDIKLVTKLVYYTFTNAISGTQAFLYQISDDGINYTDPVTSSPTFQSQSVYSGETNGILRDTGIVTYNDANSQSFRYIKLTLSMSGSHQSTEWFIYQVTEQDTIPNQVTVRIRSSESENGVNGTILTADKVINENDTLTLSTSLLLTGNPTGDYVTVEIVSFTNFDIPVTLSDITSIKEVSS